jgi:hypothetical protein
VSKIARILQKIIPDDKNHKQYISTIFGVEKENTYGSATQIKSLFSNLYKLLMQYRFSLIRLSPKVISWCVQALLPFLLLRIMVRMPVSMYIASETSQLKFLDFSNCKYLLAHHQPTTHCGFSDRQCLWDSSVYKAVVFSLHNKFHGRVHKPNHIQRVVKCRPKIILSHLSYPFNDTGI